MSPPPGDGNPGLSNGWLWRMASNLHHNLRLSTAQTQRARKAHQSHTKATPSKPLFPLGFALARHSPAAVCVPSSYKVSNRRFAQAVRPTEACLGVRGSLRAETAVCREGILVSGSHRPTFAATS